MKRLIFFYGLMMLIPCVAMQPDHPKNNGESGYLEWKSAQEHAGSLPARRTQAQQQLDVQLTEAVNNRNAEQVYTLLENNAFPQDVLDSALHTAVCTDQEEIVHLLVEHRADVTTLNANDFLLETCENSMIHYLKEHGAWSLGWRVRNCGKKAVSFPVLCVIALYLKITGQSIG